MSKIISHELGEKTVVPIGWFFFVMGALASTLVGITIYVARIEAKADSALFLNSEITQIMRDISERQMQIDRRLSRIEGKLGL